MPTNTLQGRSVLVTGASGAIGTAIVERCANDGAIVTAAGRYHRRRFTHRNVVWMTVDITDARAVTAVLSATVERTGSLDVVVNAADLQLVAPIDETSDAQFDEVIATNLKGVFNACRAAVVEMRRQGGGSIINIGSTGAFAAEHNMPIYNASKAAVHALTRSIAVDQGIHGIRCNAIAPGWIDSPILSDAFARSQDSDAARRLAVALHPVGRIGSTSDVANLVAWLASDEASFVSGSILTVDGGLTAQSPIY